MQHVSHVRAGLSLSTLFSVIALAVPLSVSAADLLFSPSSGSFASGKEFTVKVSVDPGDADVNAADGSIAFDKDTLSVVKISKDGSAFSLWTAEPAFSNSAGTIEFSGGTPTAFGNERPIISITFKGKNVGTGKASFTKGSVLAADGKGTNVYEKGNEATIEITETAAEPPPEDEEIEIDAAAAEGILPVAPVVNSTTHSKSESWYATSTAIFTWKLPPDATGVRTLISRSDVAMPTEVQAKDAIKQTLTGLEEGVWYFYVQIRNEFGWGEVGKKLIQLDTVAPAEFDIFLDEAGEIPMLKFKTDDVTSGVDRYEIIFGSTTAATVPGLDFQGGAPVPPQDGGMRELTIKAYDKAANFVAVKRQFELPKVLKPSAKGSEDEGPPPIFTIERILTILFALAVGALTVMLMQNKKKMQQDKSVVLSAVMELREKNDKVFGAMREEFEQLVGAFNVQPQLTPEERALLEEIKEVLDISEELIDSGIEELKKKVRGQ